MNERDGNGDVATLVANLRGMSFQYKLHVGELPDESEMVLLSDLADAGKAREVAQVFHAHYGTPRLRFAGSLSFQRCAHRLVGIVVGTWLLTGNVPVLAPDETALRITHGGATELHVASWHTVHGSAAKCMHHVSTLMEPLVDAFRAGTGVGRANLHGNVAATVGGVVRNARRRYEHCGLHGAGLRRRSFSGHRAAIGTPRATTIAIGAHTEAWRSEEQGSLRTVKEGHYPW